MTIGRGAEFAIFLALALALHLAALSRLGSRGETGGGAGGADAVTILPGGDGVAAMVAAWKAAPELAKAPTAVAPTPVAPIEADMPPRPPAEAPADLRSARPAPAMARPERHDLPSLPTPPVPAPDGAVALPEAPEAPTELSESAETEITEAAPAESPVPPARPDVLREPKPTADRSTTVQSTTAQPAPSQHAPTTTGNTAGSGGTPGGGPGATAAGSGGGARAGIGTAPGSTLSPGRASALQAQWGARIRTRIERARTAPAGLRQPARVIVELTVARSGALLGVTVRQSSGQPAADAAALQSVRRAGRFPAAPRGLSDPSYRFSLPISFQ